MPRLLLLLPPLPNAPSHPTTPPRRQVLFTYSTALALFDDTAAAYDDELASDATGAVLVLINCVIFLLIVLVVGRGFARTSRDIDELRLVVATDRKPLELAPPLQVGGWNLVVAQILL